MSNAPPVPCFTLYEASHREALAPLGQKERCPQPGQQPLPNMVVYLEEVRRLPGLGQAARMREHLKGLRFNTLYIFRSSQLFG